MFTVNMDKAKEIWKEKLREARKPILEKLDVEYIKNLEQNKDTTDIVNKKNLLRDVTELPELLNARTVNELRKIWPSYLNE